MLHQLWITGILVASSIFGLDAGYMKRFVCFDMGAYCKSMAVCVIMNPVYITSKNILFND